MYHCRYCGKEFEDHHGLGGHTRGCKSRPGLGRGKALPAPPFDPQEIEKLLGRVKEIIDENRRLSALVGLWTAIAGQIQEQLDAKNRG